MSTLSRRKVAEYVATQLVAGKPTGPLMQQVASYLVDHKIANQAELLVRDVEAILAREHGVVLAEVVSARELSQVLIKQIEQFVAQAEGAKQVEVNTSVDPSLLGGVIIRTPRAELDTSVRTKLNALRSN